MAEETTIENQTNTLPDEIFSEIEKISKMEKNISFLQYRQGAVEKGLSELRATQSSNDGTVEDANNVISESEPPPKDDKNVIQDTKLKPILTPIEKKRYENIGVEFIKGAQKVFDEIKKGDELKKKMSSKRIDEIKKKEDVAVKEDDKKTTSLGKMFLRLGLAITGIAILLEVFKDKIDEIIPSFSTRYDKFTSPVKNIGKRVLESISNFLRNTVGIKIDSTFDTVKDMITLFFAQGLPDAVYKSGLALIEAFGGRISDEMKNQSVGLTDATYAKLKFGKEVSENNSAVLSDPFAEQRQLAKARSKMGVSSLNKVGEAFVTDIGRILTQNAQDLKDEQLRGRVSQSHASSLLSTIVSNEMLKDNKIDNDELSLIHKNLGISESFDTWAKRDDVKKMFGIGEDRVSNNLLNAVNYFKQDIDRMHQNTQQMDAFNQMLTTERRDVVVENDGKIKVDATVVPVEISQDAFAKELNSVFTIYKNAWGGDGLSEKLLSSVTGVVNNVYKSFLEPIFIIIKRLANLYNIQLKESDSQGGKTNSPTSSGGGIMPPKSTVINVPKTDSDNPVVLIDFDLSPTVVHSANEIANAKIDLLKSMTATNEKLMQLKSITINSSSLTAKDEERIGILNSSLDVINNQLSNRIANIENYLEANDNDNIGQTTANFEAQTKTPQNK